jgi:hypothetical protein
MVAQFFHRREVDLFVEEIKGAWGELGYRISIPRATVDHTLSIAIAPPGL